MCPVAASLHGLSTNEVKVEKMLFETEVLGSVTFSSGLQVFALGSLPTGGSSDAPC